MSFMSGGLRKEESKEGREEQEGHMLAGDMQGV
jgi:hypothetical protein